MAQTGVYVAMQIVIHIIKVTKEQLCGGNSKEVSTDTRGKVCMGVRHETDNCLDTKGSSLWSTIPHSLPLREKMMKVRTRSLSGDPVVGDAGQIGVAVHCPKSLVVDHCCSCWTLVVMEQVVVDPSRNRSSQMGCDLVMVRVK